jgi:hypothetical protein
MYVAVVGYQDTLGRLRTDVTTDDEPQRSPPEIWIV